MVLALNCILSLSAIKYDGCLIVTGPITAENERSVHAEDDSWACRRTMIYELVSPNPSHCSQKLYTNSV